MAKAKHQHAVWVVTTRTFEDGWSETEFSPRMSPRAEKDYLKTHGLEQTRVIAHAYQRVKGLSMKGNGDGD